MIHRQITNSLLNKIAALLTGQTIGPTWTIKLGSGVYTPTATQTDINTPFNPVKEKNNSVGGVIRVDNTVLFAFVDDTSVGSLYAVNEIGIFDPDGDLSFIIATDDVNDPIYTKPQGQAPVVSISVPALSALALSFEKEYFGTATKDNPGVVAGITPDFDTLRDTTKTNHAITNNLFNNTLELLYPNGEIPLLNNNVAIVGSQTEPAIVQVYDYNSSGQLLKGGSILSVLVFENIPANAAGYCRTKGIFNGIKFHPAGDTNTFEDGDSVYLNSTNNGFAKTGTKKVGIVLDGNKATGIYNAVLNFWNFNSFSSLGGKLGDNPSIHISTSSPTSTDGNIGDFWFKRES